MRRRLSGFALFFSLTLALSLMSIPNSVVQAATGDLDPTFGQGGIVLTDFSGGREQGRAVAVQPDGKIVVGMSTFVNPSDSALVRYNKDGTVDSSFGNAGIVPTGFAGSGGGIAVAVQTDGKIIAVSSTFFNFRLTFGLARFNSNGSLDDSFGAGGKVVAAISQFDTAANAVAIQPDGKIVIVGASFTNFSQSDSDFLVIRYNSDGSFDPTFGNGGIVTTDYSQQLDIANSIAIQPNGKIVVGGISEPNRFFPGFRIRALARYNGDGRLDAGFGTGGKVQVSPSTGQDSLGGHIALQADGKILSAGNFQDNSQAHSSEDFDLVRYNSDGSLDDTFGNHGRATADFYADDEGIHGLTIDPLGRIIAVGYAFRPITRTQERVEFAIARFTPTGSLDTSFGAGGKSSYSFFGFSDDARAVSLQSDGKILAVGLADKGTESDSIILRIIAGFGFDFCIQDESNGNLLQINTTTGDYQFSDCAGLTISGTGSVNHKAGGVLKFHHDGGDRSITAKVKANNKATASIQLLSASRTFSITDRNTTNNTCACK